jgi:hypothetical protein
MPDWYAHGSLLLVLHRRDGEQKDGGVAIWYIEDALYFSSVICFDPMMWCDGIEMVPWPREDEAPEFKLPKNACAIDILKIRSC